MCCDIRVASDDAQLGQPEIKLGLIPGGGGTQRLPRLVGIGRALLLNLTGDFIDARTAYDWGLVERVVPRDELRDVGARDRADDRRTLARVGRRPARARADDARPLARGRTSARGRRLPPLPGVRGRRRGRRRVHREARAELHRSLRAAVLKGVGGPEQLVVEEVPEPEAADGPRDRRRPRRGDQLRRRPHPPGDVPAGAGAARRARLGGRRRGRRLARPRLRIRRRRRVRGARGGRRALAPPSARERELRGGRRLPDGVPHRLDSAHRARANRLRGTRARDRRRRRGRHRRGADREGAERRPGRRRRERGEVRASAFSRRRRDRHLRRASGSSTRSTSSSTSSEARSSRNHSRS